MADGLYYIISDLHLGNGYFHQRALCDWLGELPAEATLILNGDVIDDPRRALSAAHDGVLQQLIAESHRRRVVWVYGNHDADFHIDDAGAIEFVDEWAIDRQLLIVHGNDLDDVMPRHGVFKWVFRRVHHLFVALGWRDMHVAEYAKKWGLLYRVLNERVARNALRAAAERGFAAITCGHTHAAMDIERDGHRYLNTGAWTERPLHYVRIEGEHMELCTYEGESGDA